MPPHALSDDEPATGGSQTALRHANVRRVLDALRTSGATSQATIARLTGLSRQTVNNVVRQLVAAGEVEVGAGANARETLVSLRRPTGIAIGLDIGSWFVRAVLVDLATGHRTDSPHVPLQGGRDSAEADVDAIVGLIDGLLSTTGTEPSSVLGLGVSLPQPFDALRGLVVPTPLMPGWAATPILDVLSDRLGLQVVAANDAYAASLAELKWGAGRNSQDFVFLMAGYGLGAGIVSEGRPFHGASGLAGAIGHISVDDRGPVCTCGKRGDLSALASGRSLVSQLHILGETDATLDQLIDEARSGEVLATRLVADAGRYIGMALAHVVGILAPSRIVLGGPLADAGSALTDPIEAALRDMVTAPVGPATELTLSRWTRDASLLGAVALVIEKHGLGIEANPTWLDAPSTPLSTTAATTGR